MENEKNKSRASQTRSKSERPKVWVHPSALDAPPAPDGFRYRWIRAESVGFQDTKKGPWFDQSPLSHNQTHAKLLSVRPNLSKRDTYHCVCATVVTILKDAGFDNNEVCIVTGHRCAKSLESDDRLDRPDAKWPTSMAVILDRKAYGPTAK